MDYGRYHVELNAVAVALLQFLWLAGRPSWTKFIELLPNLVELARQTFALSPRLCQLAEQSLLRLSAFDAALSGLIPLLQRIAHNPAKKNDCYPKGPASRF